MNFVIIIQAKDFVSLKSNHNAFAIHYLVTAQLKKSLYVRKTLNK